MMMRSVATDRDEAPPRPVEDCYWVVPGRLLVGAYPGARSRAQAMDRLRRLLEAGVTCFVDLTEADELAPYEALLPFETPDGRRVEHLREPIVDHGVPASRETMARILAMIDGALESGHTVYLHCRAGIGRSAMAAGCWLAERSGDGEQALRELADRWPQAAQSRHWSRVPETDEQVRYVMEWPQRPGAEASARPASRADAAERLRGAWYGLALGDALSAAAVEAGAPVPWTQHTALALCLGDSLLDKGGSDARDQIERYLRWQREGHRTASGTVREAVATADVAKALATYLWRRLPMAGAHDPRDASATSLPRVLAAACFAASDPPAAVALAAESARTTHQSPLILETCRLYAAMLVGALRGEPPSRWLDGVPAFEPSPWSPRPLRADVGAAASSDAQVDATRATPGTVLHVLLEARHIAREARDFGSVIEAARRAARTDPATAPYGALAGTLYGAMHGSSAVPAEARARLVGAAQLEASIERWLAHGRTAGATA